MISRIGVALEFGNLMTIVLGSMEQLNRQSLDARGREQLQRAESGARQAARLIRQTLSFARHEGSTDQLVDLNEAVRGFDKMLALIAGENVKVTFEAVAAAVTSLAGNRPTRTGAVERRPGR